MSASVWDAIAGEAAAESPLWGAALRPEPEQEREAIFSAIAPPRFALVTETIYEGYLMHYGRPRLFAPPDADTAVLLGDYLYAHGLVRLAGLDDVNAVGDFAELISLCTQARAEGRDAAADGAAWSATAVLLGGSDGELSVARAALRADGDHEPLLELAVARVGHAPVKSAMDAHAGRVK